MKPAICKIKALIICFVMVFLFHVTNPLEAVADDFKNKAKAVMVYKFFQYVTWPNEMHNSLSGEACFCYYGKNPFLKVLKYIKKKKKSGPQFLIKEAISLNNVSECNLLFFSTLDDRSLEFLKKDPLPVLTVSDSLSFFDNGGMIALYFEDDRLQLEVN